MLGCLFLNVTWRTKLEYAIVSVRDAKADAFGRPVFSATVASAVRNFTSEVNRASDENAMNRYPEDFALYDLGFFDDTAGLFRLHPHPILVVSASNVKQSI